MRVKSFPTIAAAAVLFLLTDGPAVAAEWFIEYNAVTGVFCLATPTPRPLPAGMNPCPAPLGLNSWFQSGDVVSLTIVDPRQVSDYEIKISEKKIEIAGMQFRPPQSIQVTPPEPEPAAEKVQAFNLINRRSAVLDESQPGPKADVASLVEQLATAAGIEEVRVIVTSSRDAAVSLELQLRQEQLAIATELAALRGVATTDCSTASLGDTLERLNRLILCTQPRLTVLQTAVPRPDRRQLTEFSNLVSDLSDRGALFAERVTASTAYTGVATLRALTDTARERVAEYLQLFDRVEKAVAIVEMPGAIAEVSPELAAAEYRARIKLLLPDATDEAIKPIIDAHLAQLKKRDELLRVALKADLTAIQEMLGKPLPPRQKELKASLDLFVAAVDGNLPWNLLREYAAGVEANLATALGGAQLTTARARVLSIDNRIALQMRSSVRSPVSLAGLKTDLATAKARVAALDINAPYGAARTGLTALTNDVKTLKEGLDAFYVAVDNFYRTAVGERDGPHHLGQWMQNIDVTVTIAETVKYSAFHRVAGNAEAETAGDAPAKPAKPGLDPAAALTHSARFRIHMLVRWKAIAGFAASTLREREWDLRNRQKTDASGQPVLDKDSNPVTENVMVRKQDDKPQLHYVIAPAIYLKARDLYPGALSTEARFVPAVMVGVSLNDAKQFFVGPTFEPIHGLDLYVGLHIGREKLPAMGFAENSVIPSNYTTAPTRDARRYGVYFGIGFDINVFRTYFSKPADVANKLP